MEKHITAPLTPEAARSRRAGDSVLLSGTVYTARDAAHKRLCELAARGKPVLALKRLSMGPLELDRELEAGEWRMLAAEELEALKRAVGAQ